MVMVPKQRLFIIGRNYTTQVLSRQQLISCHCGRSEAIHSIKNEIASTEEHCLAMT